MMSCIKTYTGRMFDPLNPDSGLIDILDIAHALSMLCRANGHFRSFYSVGRHCINCAREAAARGYSDRVRLACLLHDASEAYLSDVTRPVKEELPKYLELEKPLQEVIWRKYMGEALSGEEYRQVFDIDDAMLYHEFEALMDTRLLPEEPELKSKPDFSFSGFGKTEQEFLDLFRKLTGEEKTVFAVGIDWMKPVWVAAEIRGGEITIRKLDHISEIEDHYRAADAVLIDIPIGLPENAAQDAARPDREARRLLPQNRKPSIFPVPCRQAVSIEDYAGASAENERILGRKLTSQSHGFSNMIRQVDEFLARHAGWKNRLAESHPEVAFQFLNDGKGLQYSKHSEEGLQERISILKGCGIDPGPVLADFRQKQHEDVLDALCLAATAKLGCERGFRTLPEKPASDSRGLKMRMVFGKQKIWRKP